MVRLFVLGLCLAILTVSQGYAEMVPAAASATVTITPAAGGGATVHLLHVEHLPPAMQVPVLLFDPRGEQTLLSATSNQNGTLDFPLTPTGAGWLQGVYRAVVALGDGQAVSATFSAGDTAPHLYEIPDLPSPTSVLHFVATGLHPAVTYELVVTLANGRGQLPLTGIADANGMLSVYLWPQQLHEPFLEAGPYQVSLPDLNLTTDFSVREHPVGSSISIDSPVLAGEQFRVHLRGYRPRRLVWAIYAGPSGQPAGELLLGQTDGVGALDTLARLPATLPGGQYLFATPYDWGETSFMVNAPTDTPTPTPTATATPTPTNTPTPTATATPTATRVPVKKRCTHDRRGHKHCHRVKPHRQ